MSSKSRNKNTIKIKRKLWAQKNTSFKTLL